jgi:hypothetical protein
MSAAAVYGTVALLAARLTPRRGRARRDRRRRRRSWCCSSRSAASTLGVHYPTDVLAGLVVGGAWAGFCAASLEAAHGMLRRRRAAGRPAAAAGQPASIPSNTRS